MNVRITDKEIHNISELLSNLQADYDGSTGPIWFRGHCDETWNLVPSIFRRSLDDEINYLRKFQQDATLLLNPRPTNSWEWLFIMRHHNVPTRLLDWTESPLVASYFATNDCMDSDGAIWVLLPLELNNKKGRLMDKSSHLPSIEDEVMDMYRPDNYSKDKDRTSAFPIAFLAPRNTPRMQSQLSVFTINHSDETPLEEMETGTHIWRYIIPHDAKRTIHEELKILKVGKFQLYPELESIGDKLNAGD
ncbi:FRG domain-containing protein [Nitrosopumilus sp.]|uniref:FRG domain-containing protein n=1 Tax=Nitrosopumilus sp. TaxID=2024843 RepID=UPI003D0E888F